MMFVDIHCTFEVQASSCGFVHLRGNGARQRCEGWFKVQGTLSGCGPMWALVTRAAWDTWAHHVLTFVDLLWLHLAISTLSLFSETFFPVWATNHRQAAILAR